MGKNCQMALHLPNLPSFSTPNFPAHSITGDCTIREYWCTIAKFGSAKSATIKLLYLVHH